MALSSSSHVVIREQGLDKDFRRPYLVCEIFNDGGGWVNLSSNPILTFWISLPMLAFWR
jgi:hypothetical protein